MTRDELEKLLINRFGDIRISIRELAEYMRVPLKTLQNRLSDGAIEIRTYKEGKQRFCDVRDLASYLDHKHKKG